MDNIDSRCHYERMLLFTVFVTGSILAEVLGDRGILGRNANCFPMFCCLLLGMVPFACSVYGAVPIVLCCMGCGYLCGAAVDVRFSQALTIEKCLHDLGPLLLLVPACFLSGIWGLESSTKLYEELIARSTVLSRAVRDRLFCILAVTVTSILAAFLIFCYRL